MVDLQECRDRIDEIDSEIIRLFEQRMKVCRKRQYQLLTEHGVEEDEELEMVDALLLKDVTTSAARSIASDFPGWEILKSSFSSAAEVTS